MSEVEQSRELNRLIESALEIRNCRKDIAVAALSLTVVRQNHKFPCRKDGNIIKCLNILDEIQKALEGEEEKVVKSLKESIKGNNKDGD